MEKGKFQKRQIAFKICIKDVLEGEYNREEGYNPNYILTKQGLKVSRANIIGCVVSKSEEGESVQSVIIDDGTGQINIRSFDPGFSFGEIQVGDFVQIVGRPREYSSEKFVNPESIIKLDGPGWFEVRRKELGLGREVVSRIEEKKEEIAEEEIQTSDDKEEESENTDLGRKKESKEEKVEITGDKGKVFGLIKEHDKGNGVDIEELIRISGIGQCEEIIEQLLREGEVFEISSGRVKVLE